MERFIRASVDFEKGLNEAYERNPIRHVTGNRTIKKNDLIMRSGFLYLAKGYMVEQ